MIICERLYRAVRERELQCISSKKPDLFNDIFDFRYYLDAMYSHEIPSHTIHKNQLYYSWTPDYEIAKQFLEGTKGVGGYFAIAYMDIFLDTEKGLPINLSKEILFAYPLNRMENWIDMLILREINSKKPNSEYIQLNNLNYNTRKKPYFLSNLLTARNSAYSLAATTQEYVLIMKDAKYTIIDDMEAYTPPSRNSGLLYTGITQWLLNNAKEDYTLKQVIKRVVIDMERDIKLYQSNNVISEVDYEEINTTLNIYRKAVA